MKETAIHSEGQCAYCKEIFAQKEMSKHLATHLKKMATEKPSRDKSFHITVGEGPFFLNLLIDADAPLNFLDDYLRAIWLECCGHMSTLMDKSKKYEFSDDEEDIWGKICLKRQNKSSKKVKNSITSTIWVRLRRWKSRF